MRAKELSRPRAVSLGLGVCSSTRGVSQGIPLDLIGMLACAELARRTVRADRLLVLLADVHAERAGLPRARVAAQVDRLIDAVRRIAYRCGMPAEIIIARDLYQTETHRDARREVERAAGEIDDYVYLETADTAALRRRYGPLLKLGWSLGGESGDARDERFFDDHYLRCVGDDVAFAYVRAGQTLSPDRPRAAPYVVTQPASRLLLDASERPAEKLAAAQQHLRKDRFRALVRYYSQVASLYGELATPVRGRPAQKLSEVLRQVWSAPPLGERYRLASGAAE